MPSSTFRKLSVAIINLVTKLKASQLLASCAAVRVLKLIGKNSAYVDIALRMNLESVARRTTYAPSHP